MKIQKPGASGVARLLGDPRCLLVFLSLITSKQTKGTPLFSTLRASCVTQLLCGCNFGGRKAGLLCWFHTRLCRFPEKEGARCLLRASLRPPGCKNPSASTKRTPLPRFAERLPGTKPLSAVWGFHLLLVVVCSGFSTPGSLFAAECFRFPGTAAAGVP